MDETHWIQNARKGDLEAFNCLVLASQDAIFQHAIWMLGEPEAAEDVTQKTFLLAYRELRSFQNGDIRCWLLRIANRLCLEGLRRRDQDHYSSLGVRDNDCEEVNSASRVYGLANLLEGNAGQNDLEEVIREGLMGLTPDLRAVITLVDLQGMDYHKTAEILGLLIRKLVLAWLGLGMLLVFSLLFLFSSGAALLPVAGVLLVLLTLLQFNQRGAQASSLLCPGLVLLVGLVLAGYYYLPALTPGQAARRFTWDMLSRDRPATRTVALDQDRAVVLKARLEEPERVSIDYTLVMRQGWGWRNVTGGGLTTGRYTGDPAVIETVEPERGSASPFTYGYLLVRDIQMVEAIHHSFWTSNLVGLQAMSN